ncbi:MAG TPA: hypothetical protein VLG91_13440 [Streptomyces sp.]|nr:hypothetical protein [Streptomyces sp.]
MLRIHFTPEDFAHVRLARTPDPLWEIVCSLHRLQTTQGRWAYADWYRSTREALLGNRPLGDAVRRLLVPVLPGRATFPTSSPRTSPRTDWTGAEEQNDVRLVFPAP